MGGNFNIFSFDKSIVIEIIHKIEFLEEDVEEVLNEDEITEKSSIVSYWGG